MRELKFRAWTHQNPSMPWSQKFVAITGNGEQMIPIGGTFTGVWHVLGDDAEGLIIEQFTGLKDKNGKEIYEGDILGGIWEGGFISWCEKCKQLQYHSAGIGCMACSGDVHWYEIAEDDGKLEVIGNIHENPELLEEER